MVSYLFPDEVEVLTEGYKLTQIYNDVKSSLERGIASESKEEQYYAGISKIEFQLLLGEQNSSRHLELFLEDIQPSINQVNQTQRQMGIFFLDVIEHFSKDSSMKLQNFKNALGILNAYIEVP
jgi:5-methylcytosine-specific restriction endonuclease McrBC GTP-binding regulatory subunit McrB